MINCTCPLCNLDDCVKLITKRNKGDESRNRMLYYFRCSRCGIRTPNAEFESKARLYFNTGEYYYGR